MAERPVYVSMDSAPYVKTADISFAWNGGFAKVQSQKNITALHSGFRHLYPGHNVLEISSRSMQEHGTELSAFYLTKYVPSLGRKIPVECVFQGSKVFRAGGPYTDLYLKTSKEAKKDERMRQSGPVTGFRFENTDYPIRPTTAFYDFIYMNALLDNEELSEAITQYDSFTDIAFNPNKSLNCQARAAAAFVGISRAGLRDKIRNFDTFLELLREGSDKKPQQAATASGPNPAAAQKKAVEVSEAVIKPGAEIIHKVFGTGIVKQVQSAVLVIDFPTVGEKKLGLQWVRQNCVIQNKQAAYPAGTT